MGKNIHRESSNHLTILQRKRLHRKTNPSHFNLINGDIKPRKTKESPNSKQLPLEKELQRFRLLHSEIIDYAHKVQPQGVELSLREKTIQLFTDIIYMEFPQWTVYIFGSYAQGTQTIYSDLDFVVFKSKEETISDFDMLQQIRSQLWKKHFACRMRIIPAKVPIIKVMCQRTGINMDISVNRNNGCEAAMIINNRLKEIPMLHPIILLLKMLLRKNNLNEPHTGGMSSFLLFSLVFFYFQRMVKCHGAILEIDPDTTDSSIRAEEKNQRGYKLLIDVLSGLMNYGRFLTGFLKYYSTLDYEHHTISLRNGGIFIERKPIGNDDEEEYNDSSTYLSVENFQDKNLDIGKSCFNFICIRVVFQKALTLLEQAIASNDKSILSSLNL